MRSEAGTELDEVLEVQTQTSIPILNDSTLHTEDDTNPNVSSSVSLYKAACRAPCLFIPWLLLFFVVGSIPLLIALLLLLLSFVISSIAQLVRHGDQYHKATQLKFVIRFWIFIVIRFLAGVMVPVILISMRVWNMNHVMVMGLSIANWFDVIIPNFCSLCALGFIVNLFVRLLPPLPLGHDETGLTVQEAVSEILDCLFLLWSVYKVVHQSASLKQHEILGLYTWEWMKALILVVIGYNVVRLCTHLSVWLIRIVICDKLDPTRVRRQQHKMLITKLLPREFFVYYANGLKRSISFILSSLLTLLTWVLYFRTRLSNTPEVDNIGLFVTQTCISVLVFSVLWLLKIWIVLSWEASVMYTRLRSQILDSGSQLYFLGILGRQSHDIFKLTYYGPVKKKAAENHWVRFVAFIQTYTHELYSHPTQKGGMRRLWHHIIVYLNIIIDMTSPDFLYRSTRDSEEESFTERTEKDSECRVQKISGKKRKNTKYDLLMHNRAPTTYNIKQVAEYLISAKPALSDMTFVSSIMTRLTGDADIRMKLKQLIDEKSNVNAVPSVPSGLPAIPENAEFSSPVTTDDWEYFMQMVLGDESCSESFIQTWLEKLQNNCLFLANALSSTKEVVDVLDTIMSCLLIGATFIMWLLLTGVATTKVLVLVASPLLAATFIFGDTCKTLFQGIMYVYIVHPIHVGDLCSVDDNKMVVKAVGVWTTTFCKVEKLGTLEQVTYPNSELANKVVANYLTEFVWDDHVEFKLGSIQNSLIKELKKQIETYLLNEEKDEFVPCSYCVVVVQSGEDFKIVIELKYMISNIQNWSYLKCVRRKKKLVADIDALSLQFKERYNPSN